MERRSDRSPHLYSWPWPQRLEFVYKGQRYANTAGCDWLFPKFRFSLVQDQAKRPVRTTDASYLNQRPIHMMSLWRLNNVISNLSIMEQCRSEYDWPSRVDERPIDQRSVEAQLPAANHRLIATPLLSSVVSPYYCNCENVFLEN